MSAPDPDPDRDETEAERVVRNFNELLQELRVLQTGVQILLAFLLTLPFTPVFDGISDNEKGTYGWVIVAATTAVGLLVAPVAVHRVTFRRRMKPRVLRVAHVLTIAGVLVQLVAIVGAVGLAASVALEGAIAIWLTAVSAAVLVGLWIVLPVVVRLTADPQPQA